MIFNLDQTFFLFLLLFAFYGCLKSLIEYKKKRDFKYLVILVFFFLIVPQIWMKAYYVRVEEFLLTFQFVITLIPLVMFVFYDYWEKKQIKERKAKEKIKSFFERYVNPHVISTLLTKSKLELKGEKRHVAVFFMDIRGFTKLSENNPPELVVKLLNKYFDISTTAIFKRDGTVDKFVGDCVMAYWNAPTDVVNPEIKAFEAGLEIQQNLQQWGKIKSGIGIHVGEAIVGNIGSKHMVDYTLIGDTVNTAARLESQTKDGDLVVSEAVYEKIKHKYKTRRVENVRLKGKSKLFKIYRFKTKKMNYKIRKNS